nr:DNA helicase [Tanacetum cinerariifolium]
MLLCHRKGCKSPIDVRTINDQIFPTYRAACEALGLHEALINGFGKSVKDFGLRTPPPHLLEDLKNKLLMDERNYKHDLLRQETLHAVLKLNSEQRKIYDLIMNATLNNIQEFIKDEAPMNDRQYFEPLDRTLRDLMNTPEFLFGGKTVILGGDFRQTLPVKNSASKSKLVVASIAESYLWWHFRVCTLTENMWLQRPGEPEEQDDGDTSWIIIPPEYFVSTDETGMSELIDFIYDQETLKTPIAGSLQEKAIFCPKNDTADLINAKILLAVEGRSKIYLSNDEAIPLGGDKSETERLYPMEYLNTMNFPGFPPHELEPKVGSPIMLLRNVNLLGGLCNGTRMIVRSLKSKVIEAQIITGTRVNDKVFIDKIPLMHKDPNFPFTFKRK